MPEQNNDFEEVETPVTKAINKNKNDTSNGNILNFNRKNPNVKTNNTSSNTPSSMPNKNINEMPQLKNNMASNNTIQKETPNAEKSNVLPFDRNKKKLNDNLRKNKANNNSNNAKKDNVLPFGKNKNKDTNKNNENKKGNNSLKDKLGKKKNQLPVGRKKIYSDGDSTSDDKEMENGESGNDNKPEEKNKLGQKKDGLGSKLDKLRHPGQSLKNGAKDAVKVVVKKILKPIKIKLMTSIGALVGGLAVCFFVLYLILSPLMDIWPYIDETVRTGANYTEKFLNFFRGFGFEDSKEAFYKEAESLNKYYNNSLDMPLLLSTLFYPEIQKYNMEYDEHMEIVNGDPVTSLLSGGPRNFVSFIKNWIKDAFVDESNNTYDENGLIYNANKIYRLRRLAAAMADRDSSSEVTVPLSKFLLGDDTTMGYAGMFGKAVKDFLSSVIGGVLDIIKDIADLVVSEFLDLVTFDFDAMHDDFEKFVQNISDTGGNIIQAFAQLINVVSFGFCAITSISFAPLLTGDEITVTYKPYKFNKEKYDNYVMDYYFEDTIEYRKMLPSEDATEIVKTQAKRRILNEIYASKETFEEIFLDVTEGEAEEYVDNCAGAINNDLVKELTRPIDASEGQTFNIAQNELFGIRNGYKQNGVILTSSNSGIKLGGNVYSVADGTIEEVHHSTDKEDSNSIGGKTGVGGSTANKTYTLTDEQYKALASQAIAEQGTAEGIRFEISQMLNLFETKKRKNKTSANNVYEYVLNSGWYSCSAQHMDSSCASGKGCYCSKKGKWIVYKYTDEAVQIVKDVVENGTRTMPSYVTEHDCWDCSNSSYCPHGRGDICKLEVNGRVITDLSEIKNRANYIKDVTKIYTNSTKTNYYVFYGFANDHSDPFGYYVDDKNAVDRETQNVTEQSSNYVTIRHEIVYNNGQNKDTVYSIYKYLGSIPDTIKVGDRVSKGQVIGTIGTVFGYSEPSLYFEFQNSSNTPINPNNLFIKCAGAYDSIWPCESTNVTDIFGNRYQEMKEHRDAYGEGGTVIHKAIDIGNGRGAAYYSICNGVVEKVNDTAYHKTIVNCGMDSNNEEVHIVYEHGDAISGLKIGQTVKTGEKIGTSNGWGKTNGSHSYGPHLHLEVYTKDSSGKIVYQNPLMYLYGMSYDGVDDGNMTCSIVNYDGSPLTFIGAHTYASNGLNREAVNFNWKYSTGAYDQSDIYNDKGNFYN